MLVRFLTRGWFALFIAMALTPALFEIGPRIESRFFPVVSDTRIERIAPEKDGISFYALFDQQRQCEFKAITWYSGAQRIGVAIEPDAHLLPKTRPEGDQLAGPWTVTGVASLEGTRAYVHHRCHPLWNTISPFYP